MKIKHFGIVARDPQALKQFYSDLLETPPSFVSETSEYCEFDVDGNAKLDIEPVDVLAIEIGQESASEKRPLIRVETDDVAAVFEKATAKKMNVLAKPKEKSWREKSFHLLDPENNLIEIFQKL
jgi:lactoylglutathione lyase